MDAFHTHTGIGVPLRRSNVDTDQIIPAVYLKRVTRTGFDDGLFAAWRTDPSFVLNLSPFDRGSVLVAGPDFGTGSSREHAVWALQDYGFEAVVSPRFADIFRNNATKTGLLPVEVDAAVSVALMAAVRDDPSIELTIDVERRLIAAPAAGIEAKFVLDDFTRDRFLHGLDDIGVALRHEGEITAFEHDRPAWLPVVSAR
jgi:3-isopropylmalate/(R)-2-methylmalate dehydratase small subunit